MQRLPPSPVCTGKREFWSVEGGGGERLSLLPPSQPNSGASLPSLIPVPQCMLESAVREATADAPPLPRDVGGRRCEAYAIHLLDPVTGSQ